MIKKRLLLVLPLVFIFCACGAEKQIPEEAIVKDRTLNVAISQDMQGYFIVGGESYGYAYELLSAYSVAAGKEMHLETGLSQWSIDKYLTDGEADIVVSLSVGANGDGILSLPLYSTNYVILASSANTARYNDGDGSITDFMQEAVIMVSPGFEGTASYDMLLDSLSSACIYVSPREGFDMARSLSRGEFDMLICEKSEALLAVDILRNIECVYEYDEQVPVSLMFDSRNSALYDDFNAWLAGYCTTADYASLGKTYFEKGFGKHFPAINAQNRVVGGISVWDDVIREVGEREGIDWRLLSAIAYNESRFHTDVVSPQGAQGLMQIMPVVARHFNMEGRDLRDPRTSLTLASKLIKSIDNMIGFADETTDDDRLSITIAAYNGGIGNIQTARRLAKAHNEDPDRWESVSKYLVLMGDTSFDPQGIEYRRFSGSGETLAFVNNVLERYDTYRRTVR